MSNKKKVTPKAETPAPSTKEVVAALTNSPELSLDEFTLGDRTFKLMFLSYDDQLKFMSFLKPLLEGAIASLAGRQGVTVPGIEITPDNLNVTALLSFCAKDLPEMVRIMCAQTDPSVTIEDVKRLGGDPFTLAGTVMKQIAKNKMIEKFIVFFAPLLMTWKRMTTQPKASTTGETPQS